MITSGAIHRHVPVSAVSGPPRLGWAVAWIVAHPKSMSFGASSASKSTLADTSREPHVAFVGFGASSLDHHVYVWSTPANFLDMLHEVRCLIYQELDQAGIDIPFDQVVLHADPASLEAYMKRG